MMNIENLEMINADEVPDKRYKSTDWDNIFSSIPKGKALIIPKEVRTAAAVKRALRLRHQQNKFQGFYIVQRADKAYIINPSDPENL